MDTVRIVTTDRAITAYRPPGLPPAQWARVKTATVRHLDGYIAGLRGAPRGAATDPPAPNGTHPGAPSNDA